jgi:hypothetical protein
MIPVYVKLLCKRGPKKSIRLFIPIILLWVVLLVLLAAFSPLVFITSLILLPGGHGKNILAIYAHLFVPLCSISGLGMLIENKEKNISLQIK